MEADLYLMPSIAEALPVALMEAHAAGLPCIATCVGSTDEILLDGRSGFLVAPQDASALTDKLEYLVENQQLWPEMGRVGRKHVEDNYDINVLNRELESIFERLLEGH
jgi:glycosyltransferase involved in cell wall biosynthesis